MDDRKNNLDEVRDILLDTMRALKAGTVDPDAAAGIRDLGQTLINSAKVEVDFLKVTGSANETGFIAPTGRQHQPRLPSANGSVPRIGR